VGFSAPENCKLVRAPFGEKKCLSPPPGFSLFGVFLARVFFTLGASTNVFLGGPFSQRFLGALKTPLVKSLALGLKKRKGLFRAQKGMFSRETLGNPSNPFLEGDWA